MTPTLTPGAVPLASWRAILDGAVPRLDRPACRASRARPRPWRRSSPGRAGLRHQNGFGKLATVRIGAEDLGTLQRNIVLSHAAGIGEPMPVPVAG